MQVSSFFLNDLTPEWITIEYSARFQIPGFQILGLPAPEIQEARDRIISAFEASGLPFPKKRVLINLAPASIRKSGTGHDLAIALKIISETTPFPSDRVLARGELGLDGSIRPSGRMGALIELLSGPECESGSITLILGPHDYSEFARLLHWRARNGFSNPRLRRLIRAKSLGELIHLLERDTSEVPLHSLEEECESNPIPILLPQSPLQERALKIACIGRHHTLLLGPKGVGKSATLDWFQALKPPARPVAAWERALYQESRNEPPRFEPPTRMVHSNVRPAHLLGSFHSGVFRAGELSLAHGGMLFADEFPEWPRDSKECLREPLQSEVFQLTSVRGTLQAKCDLQLIGSGNLCPCGGLPHRFRTSSHEKTPTCRCPEGEVRKYLSRLSGPILDRIDLWVIFANPTDTRIQGQLPARTLFDVKAQVDSGRALALNTHGVFPSRIPPDRLEKLVPHSSRVHRILTGSGSLRNRHKLIRIACSIAALEKREAPVETDFLEARTYRIQEHWN